MHMRKITVVALAAALVLALAACGSGNSGETTAPAVEAGPLEILNTVWNSIPEDNKFPASGGDYNNPVDNAPGAFDISDTENLEYLLSVPADSTGLIQEAASLMHMMNSNTFTCGAFRAVSQEDAKTLADAMHTAISEKHWMCGFPDKQVIARVGNVVISMYGAEDLIDAFRDGLTGGYSSTEILYDEPIL